jgi:hypothetical protein
MENAVDCKSEINSFKRSQETLTPDADSHETAVDCKPSKYRDVLLGQPLSSSTQIKICS